jgi:hypothetical protein
VPVRVVVVVLSLSSAARTGFARAMAEPARAAEARRLRREERFIRVECCRT